MAHNLISQEDMPDALPWTPEDLEPSHGAQMKLPTAEDLERFHREAHLEGYETGRREGLAAGYREGQAKAKAEADRLRMLADSLEEALKSVEQELGQELLSLSLDIARQMLRRALKVKPELLLPVVRSAMESLPHNAQHPHIHLHPDDAALVREMLETELLQAGWKVVEDMRITRGGVASRLPPPSWTLR